MISQDFKNKLKKRIFGLVNQTPEVVKIKEELEIVKVHLSQLHASMRIYNNLDVPPPENIQRRVVGGYFSDFVESGNRNLVDFNVALNKQGKSLSDFSNVLDFGCGCGRIFMNLHKQYGKLNIFGSDIDAEAIDYCNAYLNKVGQFKLNQPNGPSEFEDNSFDLIYGISVFSHLPEEMQFSWLNDLHRVSQPGAFLLLSVENKKTEIILNEIQRKEFEKKGFYFYSGSLTEGLPEFYRTTVHSHEYILKEWSRYFEILDIIPKGMMEHQDLILCRKRTTE